jgi:mannosyltransferase
LLEPKGDEASIVSISALERRVTAAVEPSPPRDPPWDAAGVALLAMTVSAAGAARPSLWFDEAATISAATRSVPALWRMLSNIDAVHGVYYLLMHGWFAVFPATEFASRLSSALAVGLAAAGVVVLGRQISTRAVAVTAGLVFAILPRVTWAGMETRSYALSMVVAVWLTVFCIAAARRGRARWWLSYGLLLAGATLLNVFVLLIVPAHAVAVVAFGRSPTTWRRWAVAALVATTASMPFLVFSQSQLFQVGWISSLGGHTVGQVLAVQYFDLSLLSAVAAGVILAGGIARGLRAAVPHPGRLVWLTVTWMLVPTAILLGYSALRHPIYYPRYLSFTTPAAALLFGLCVVALGRSRSGIAAVLTVCVTVAAPNYLAQRGPYAKADMDFSAVADVIDRYAAPGDCLVLDNSTTWKPGPIRPLTAARPAVFAKLRDYGRGRTALQRNRLWDSHIAIWAWADKLPDCPALWTVSERDATLPDHQAGSALEPGPRLGRAMAYQVPSRFGFHVVERWQFSFAQVAKSVRD